MSNDIRLYKGSKFYRYIDGCDDPEVIRIRKVDQSKDMVGYYDSDWNKKTMSFKELIDNYNCLKADGIIIFSIVKVQDAKDVIVALQRVDATNMNLPYAICRQSIYDFLSNLTSKDPTNGSVGVSVSQDTCPANINFADVLTCTDIVNSIPIAIYLDDSLDDILRFIYKNKYNKILVELKDMALKQLQRNGQMNISGYCDTIDELLTLNNFMFDFRGCFKIKDVPYHIDEESEGLSMNNIIYLEKELKVNIMETYLIKYSREIDLKSIKRDYILISSEEDKHNAVYILGYDKSDNEYVPRDMVI